MIRGNELKLVRFTASHYGGGESLSTYAEIYPVEAKINGGAKQWIDTVDDWPKENHMAEIVGITQ